MEIFQFDRGEKVIERYGSAGLRATRVAVGTGEIQLTCPALAPSGVIGTHPATGTQLFLVIAGEGWVAGPDAQRVPGQRGVGRSLGRRRRAHERIGSRPGGPCR